MRKRRSRGRRSGGRRLRTKSMSYYRKNPLTTTELVVGGLVTVAVVGVGFYLLYNYLNGQSAGAGLASVNAATGQTTLPGGTGAPTATQYASMQGTQAALNQGQFATAQGGQPSPTYGTTNISQ